MKCMESKLSKMLFVSGLLASLGAVAPSAATSPGALPVPSPMAVAAVQAAAPGAVSATVEKLRETADAIRGRIAALPRRPCTLSVEWRRYTTLMEYVLSRLTDESDAREREHALFVLGEIDKFVTMAGKHNAETCVDYDDAAEAERTGQRQLQQARHRLLLVVNAIQGDGFPFARFGDFQRFYNGVNWNDHVSTSEYWMEHFTTNLEQIYRLVQRNTTVNRGQVRVTLPRGQQKVSTRFTGTKWGFLEKNWLYWSVSESIHAGAWQLHTVRFNRNCSGKDSANHCYGSTLRKLEAAQGRYRLSTMVSRQMQSALQAHVTAACKRTITNQEAMRDLVLEHRPDDKQVRQAYEGVADRFLAKIGHVARSGADKLCPVSKQRFMDGLLDVAVDAWNRELGPGLVPREVYERFRDRLKRELDITGNRILDEYTPPFAAVEAAARLRPGTERDVVEAKHAHEEAGHPSTVLARALDPELPPVARARLAAQAARGFAAIVEAEPAGDVTAEAIAARHSALDAARNAEGYARAAAAAEAAGRDRASAAAAMRAISAARKAWSVVYE